MVPPESPLHIRQLTVHEGPRLRVIRLRALADAPDAFAITHAEAAARPPESWSQQLGQVAAFVAVRDGADVGLARCASDEQRADTVWLFSMWVAPEARGQGTGDALVDAVIEHARSSGAARLLLEVADANEPAIALYARKGFAPNGVTGSLPPPRDHIREHQRELRLR